MLCKHWVQKLQQRVVSATHCECQHLIWFLNMSITIHNHKPVSYKVSSLTSKFHTTKAYYVIYVECLHDLNRPLFFWMLSFRLKCPDDRACVQRKLRTGNAVIVPKSSLMVNIIWTPPPHLKQKSSTLLLVHPQGSHAFVFKFLWDSTV